MFYFNNSGNSVVFYSNYAFIVKEKMFPASKIVESISISIILHSD